MTTQTDQIYVKGYGSSSAKLLICGEAPGKHEEERGFPFAGPSGDLLNQSLDYAGISRNDCYLTNVVKIRPPGNKIDDLKLIGRSIEEFLPQLFDEITVIDPNCILALGNTALQAITGYKGIEKYRGSILQAKTGHKVVAALHPAALMPHDGAAQAMHKWSEFSWLKADVKRAVEQSLFKEYRPPARTLHVASNSAEVMRFLSKNEGNIKVTLDVETNKTIPQCIGLAFNDWEAMSIPLFNDDEIPDHDQAIIWRNLSEFLYDTNKQIMAQNAKFDEKRCRQIGLKWHDCWFDMAMGWHVLYPEFPKKLQFISSVITEEPYYKDEGIEFNKHKVKKSETHIIGKEEKTKNQQWFLYNAKDAVVEYECCTKILAQLKEDNLYEFFFDKIMPLHRIYSNIEDTGILIDSEVRKHLGNKYRSLRDIRQEKLINDISGGNADVKELYKNFNVNSNGMKNQVAKLVFGYLKMPLRKDTSDETLKSLTNNVAKNQQTKDILMGILEVRKLRKTISTYVDASLSDNDVTRFGNIISNFENIPRMHTQTNLNGTESFRTSTGILQPPVSVVKEGIALQTMTKHEDAQMKGAGGADLRAMFIADKGFSFVEPDGSQAEDRVVCVLSKDWTALKDYERTEFKINKYGIKDDRHTKTAISVCSMVFENITDYYRQIGKKTRHAGNYDMKKHMHMLNLAKFAGVYISEYAAGKQLDRFHLDNPNIKGVYHAEVQQALQDNNCTLFNPFGHRRIFYNKWGEDLWKEAYAHIPQSTVSDLVKFAMLRISRRLKEHYLKDFFFLEESHDSFLSLVRDLFIEKFVTVTKEEMEMPIDFNKCTLQRNYQLVIPCEVQIGKRWISYSEEYKDGMRKVKI